MVPSSIFGGRPVLGASSRPSACLSFLPCPPCPSPALLFTPSRRRDVLFALVDMGNFHSQDFLMEQLLVFGPDPQTQRVVFFDLCPSGDQVTVPAPRCLPPPVPPLVSAESTSYRKREEPQRPRSPTFLPSIRRFTAGTTVNQARRGERRGDAGLLNRFSFCL